MFCNILVVEDEIFVAAEIEDVVAEMGHRPIGIAADRRTALALGMKADIAFVDLNLRDGPTGKEIGRTLAGNGVTVLFMTANPSQLGGGVHGTIGVMSKPVTDGEIKEAVNYAMAKRHRRPAERPRRLMQSDRISL